MPTRVAYLGPEGTYAERAAFALTKLETLVKSTFRRAKRAGFFGVLDPLLETNTSKIANSWLKLIH